VLQRWHREYLEDQSITPAWVIAKCQRHVEEQCRGLGVQMRVLDDVFAGKARFLDRIIEGPPIRSLWSYATWEHEIAHFVLKCTHKRVSTILPGKTVCPECEVLCWCYAREHSIVPWTRDMQNNLADALPSYLRHARGDVAWQIHAMADTPLAKRKAQLERAKERT